jgi:hypothetical protein
MGVGQADAGAGSTLEADPQHARLVEAASHPSVKKRIEFSIQILLKLNCREVYKLYIFERKVFRMSEVRELIGKVNNSLKTKSRNGFQAITSTAARLRSKTRKLTEKLSLSTIKKNR